jgi:hypothetical protein
VDIPTQKALALSGPISLILTVSSLHMMGFIPLPPATMGAEQIAAFYREHSAALCRGLIVFMISAGVFLDSSPSCPFRSSESKASGGRSLIYNSWRVLPRSHR